MLRPLGETWRKRCSGANAKKLKLNCHAVSGIRLDKNLKLKRHSGFSNLFVFSGSMGS
jgi:hypothetical protein